MVRTKIVLNFFNIGSNKAKRYSHDNPKAQVLADPPGSDGYSQGFVGRDEGHDWEGYCWS